MCSPVVKGCPSREMCSIGVKCKYINAELQTKDSAIQFTNTDWQYFIIIIIIILCMCTCMCVTTCLEISFLHVGPWD